MRVSKSNDHLSVKAIAGNHVVLMALDMDEQARAGLRGFAIKRGQSGQPQDWLRGIKYFKDLVATPSPETDYSSRVQPFQTFLWSDYRGSPGTDYDFTIVALYGDLHAMEERHTLTFSIKTEQEYDANGQGVWFNRGAIASHAFETQFHNKALTPEMTNDVSDDGKLLDSETQWLSRGLAEACLKYINGAKPGQGLRVCAYEFTYLPVLLALKRAHDRGVDVQIVFHDTKKDTDPNRKAIAEAKLPASIVHPRTRTQIPHNKFIVKLVSNKPQQVWTGSTNFTDTGFYGQTNVGHIVANAVTAKTYLDYWTELKGDPVHSEALKNAIGLTPNPPNGIAKSSVVAFFSPRIADNMLDWYGQRITDTATLAMMTIPFNVANTILAALGKTRDAMRLVILEDIPTAQVSDAEKRNRGKLAFSNGAILGKSFIKYKTGVGGAKVAPIPNSDLDKWFVDEELAHPTNRGPRVLCPRQDPADRPPVGRSPGLLGLGEFFDQLADEQRREHAADPRRYARGGYLHDRARPHLQAFPRARHHQQRGDRRAKAGLAAARHHRQLDRVELPGRDLQEQSPAAVLPGRNSRQTLECARGRRPRSVRR